MQFDVTMQFNLVPLDMKVSTKAHLWSPTHVPTHSPQSSSCSWYKPYRVHTCMPTLFEWANRWAKPTLLLKSAHYILKPTGVDAHFSAWICAHAAMGGGTRAKITHTNSYTF